MKKTVAYFIVCISLLSIVACKDFLIVDSPSKDGTEYVFSNREEINRMLSGVYAPLMKNEVYGEYFISRYALNTDVEFKSFTNAVRSTQGNEFSCFDGTRYSSDIGATWKEVYKTIDRANVFISELPKSPIYDPSDSLFRQQLGEAKCIRAMLYHDLVVHWGDIPFLTQSAYESDNLYSDLTDRNEILDFLIADLRNAATGMMYADRLTYGIERISKNFCYALIARMAMTRGGYSLYPDKNDASQVGTMQRPNDYLEYYEIARNYADSVITSGKHSLTKSYRQVFIDECNYLVSNSDDPLFEIPFLKGSSGRVGHVHGPTVSADANDFTPHVWGPTSGTGIRLHPLYFFYFDEQDLRRDYTVSLWNYNELGQPTLRLTYAQQVNKWSKLWTNPAAAMGSNSSSYTGFNFPYMRYADVLLLYAEAVNELENGVNGANGQKAREALKQVRKRAFAPEYHAEKVDNYVDSVGVSKDEFFNAIVDERAWEFGGENIRWKDLVRWNLLAKKVYQAYNDMKIVAHDALGNPIDDIWDGRIPMWIYWRIVNNPNNIERYPNTQLPILELYNWPNPPGPHPGGDWTYAEWFQSWANTTDVVPKNECLYSFRGYIRGGTGANDHMFNPNNLPPVRYIFPIPNSAIVTNHNRFKNYYGYN